MYVRVIIAACFTGERNFDSRTSMMPQLASRLDNVKVSASAAMTDKARELRAQGIQIISLSSGEPDFPTPPHAIEAAHQAALAGDTKYPAQPGTAALRAALSRILGVSTKRRLLETPSILLNRAPPH
jgi:aspartate/methionine/tyrosine aminotransferase